MDTKTSFQHYLLEFFCRQKLDDQFNIGSTTDDFIHRAILQIIEDNWDSFYEVEASRAIKAVCYRLNEAMIVSRHVFQIKNSNCIRDCAGLWGAL